MSIFNSTGVYDYVNVLQKAADASWRRNEAISNNIANVDTPNYKRQDVDFESALAQELKHSKYRSMDDKVAGVTTSHLNVKAYTDYTGYSYRLDGNNVDIDTENAELAANQIKYSGLMNSISQEFANLQLVMK